MRKKSTPMVRPERTDPKEVIYALWSGDLVIDTAATQKAIYAGKMDAERLGYEDLSIHVYRHQD